MSFRNFRLATKQAIGFGLILAIMTAVNIYSINKMATMKTEVDQISNNWLPRAIAIGDLSFYVSELRRNQLQFALANDEAGRQDLRNQIIALIDQINANVDLYESLKAISEKQHLYSEKERQLYDAFDAGWEGYLDLSFSFMEYSAEGNNPQALHLLNNDARIVYDGLSQKLEELVEANKQEATEAFGRAELAYTTARAVTRVLLVATFILSVLLAAALVRYTTVPVKNLEAAARQIAAGNLDVELKQIGRDEIGNLASSFNQMAASLRDATARLHQQADELRNKNQQLEENSRSLERQKAVTERKNQELEHTMQRLKETQNQLVQSEKLASLGQLTAGIAHEINNPINFVSSNLNPIKRDLEDLYQVLAKYQDTVTALQLDEQFAEVERLKADLDFDYLTAEIKQLLSGIEEGAQRTAEIVRGLRNFSRMDEDEKKLADVNQGIESTLVMLTNRLKNRIEVIKEYGDLPQIHCYPGKLNQVIMNVITNAIQAIPDKGRIFITTAYDGEIVTISIKDTGPGMTEEVRRRIFEPFFTTKEVGEGTGLGLSITYGIIEDHDGNIEVKTEPGKGTEFIITLPAHSQE